MQSGSRRCLTTATKQSTLLTPASLARGNATKAAAAAVNVKESNVKREHPLFDVRRLKARSGWKPKPPRNADEEIFPDERLGNIIDLNWSLTPYGVVPNNDLFRNLHLRGLQMLTKSKIDSQKAVHVTLNNQEETWQQFYVPPPQPAPAQAPPAPQGAAPGQPAADPAPAPPSPPQLFAPRPNATPISPNSYKQLYKEVRKFLSASPNIFMHDGAVGTNRLFEEVSRFVVSDADTALLLKHIIPPIPLQNPKEHRESVTSFVASGLQLRNPEEVGLQGNNFTVVDFAQHRILVGGTRSAEALQQAIASLVTYQLAHKGVLPLSASSILGADGKPILVFGSSLNFSRNDLFGSSGHLWSPVGVSRLFNGAITPYNNEPLSRGDMVWTAGGKSSVVAPLSKSAHPCAGHPAKVVFVTEGTKTELNKLTSDKAAERYTTSFNFPVYISHAILKERFEQALKEHKVSVFELSVNSKSKDKEAEAKALLLKN